MTGTRAADRGLDVLKLERMLRDELDDDERDALESHVERCPFARTRSTR